MYKRQIIVSLLVALTVSACGEEGKSTSATTMKISGYPVYKFLNFFGIDKQALEASEKEAREVLGENYESYVKNHEAMVSAGFDQHESLRVIRQDGDEVEIYVRRADYQKLWKTSPHDLNEQGKSHLVTVEYEAIQVGDQVLNRATSFQAKLVEYRPTIRK